MASEVQLYCITHPSSVLVTPTHWPAFLQEYNALGDVVGAVSKGLAPDLLQQLPRLPASQVLQQECSCNTDQQQHRQEHSTAAAAAAVGAATSCKATECTCAAASTM